MQASLIYQLHNVAAVHIAEQVGVRRLHELRDADAGSGNRLGS
jgi:hypothetical protein